MISFIIPMGNTMPGYIFKCMRLKQGLKSNLENGLQAPFFVRTNSNADR